MKLLEKHPVDTAPVRQFESLTGVKLPDLVAPIRKLDLDADRIRQSVTAFQAVADELESLHTELSGSQQQLTDPAVWQGQAATAAAGFGETLLDILKWILAVILLIVMLLLVILALISMIVTGLLKLVDVIINDFLKTILSAIVGIGFLKGQALRQIAAVVLRVFGHTAATIAGIVALAAGQLAWAGDYLTQGLLWLTWQLGIFAAQLTDSPKSEATARRHRDAAGKSLSDMVGRDFAPLW